MDESFKFYHIAKNVESEQTLLNNFSGGLRPIGEDTADASQKQASGLYFWGEKTSASRHVKYLTGGIEGGRENEVSNKVGEIEFKISPDKITFPEFRIDIERNEIRAKVVEAPMSKYLNTLNHPEAIKELAGKVELQEGEQFQGYSMQEMKYVEKNPNSKSGSCLCLNVLKDGQPVVRRAGVQDVEETAVWLSAKEEGFRDTYSNNLRDILRNPEKMSQEGLAFKYCGKESLPISKINLHENNNGVYEQKTIFDKGASENLTKEGCMEIEETNYIGKTFFVDEKATKKDQLDQGGKIVVLNFPGSGMSLASKNEKDVLQTAVGATLATKDLLLAENAQFNLEDCSFYTAVYEQKADKAIKEYNEEDKLHSQAIFNQAIAPLISKDYAQTFENLNRLIMRGHCFGCMVISETEVLLAQKLKEIYPDKKAVEIEKLLSAPKALLSSPALQLDKYPKHFQTVAIVNNSDRTITSPDYCGDRLKTSKIKKGNVDFYVSNRSEMPEKYSTLQNTILSRLGVKDIEARELADNEAYVKQVKKNLNGHEYYFLPSELKNHFAQGLKNSILNARISQQKSKTNVRE